MLGTQHISTAGEDPFDLPITYSYFHKFKVLVLALKDKGEMSRETNPRFFPFCLLNLIDF